ELPDGTQQGDGQQPPELPDGNGNGMPGGMMGGPTATFTEGEETATFDLNGAAITVEAFPDAREGSMDDITVDAVITLEIGNQNTVTSVLVKNIGNTGTTEGQLGSWNMGDSSDYEYDTALFIDENGIDEDASDRSRLSAGTVTDTCDSHPERTTYTDCVLTASSAL
ncbi:MAG: hypothetical protein HUJ67_00290, partial [Ruminiclostridium sp.]|nr:hypothetical protein [Ruminiclostridium sp.]